MKPHQWSVVRWSREEFPFSWLPECDHLKGSSIPATRPCAALQRSLWRLSWLSCAATVHLLLQAGICISQQSSFESDVEASKWSDTSHWMVMLLFSVPLYLEHITAVYPWSKNDTCLRDKLSSKCHCDTCFLCGKEVSLHLRCGFPSWGWAQNRCKKGCGTSTSTLLYSRKDWEVRPGSQDMLLNAVHVLWQGRISAWDDADLLPTNTLYGAVNQRKNKETAPNWSDLLQNKSRTGNCKPQYHV